MNLREMLTILFGTKELLGLNVGFWASMALVALIVTVMNLVFWSMKPKTDDAGQPEDEEGCGAVR